MAKKNRADVEEGQKICRVKPCVKQPLSKRPKFGFQDQ